MSRPPDELLGAEALGDRLDRLLAAVRPTRVVTGWATVDLDRAAGEVGVRVGASGGPADHPAADDQLLGARTRLLRVPGNDDVVLLEPSTEGPLAASLARFGEGSVALYLQVDGQGPDRASRAGFLVTAEAGGPLGRERRVLGGPPWGPHLILVVEEADAPPATIEP